MARLLIVKTGDAFPEVVREYGDFEVLFRAAIGDVANPGVEVFDARREPLPDLSGIDGADYYGLPQHGERCRGLERRAQALAP